MNRTSTVVILGESWRFGNLHDSATTIFEPFKTFGVNRGGLWAWPKS